MDSEKTEIVPLEDNNTELLLRQRNDDYTYGRELLYSAAERMQDVLDLSIALAQEAQHPRAIEVAKDTAQALADISSKIMKHHEQQQKISGEVVKAKQVTNNNLNVKMSSKELLELLRKDD